VSFPAGFAPGRAILLGRIFAGAGRLPVGNLRADDDEEDVARENQ